MSVGVLLITHAGLGSALLTAARAVVGPLPLRADTLGYANGDAVDAERIQAADADLYLRTKKRALEHGDVRPLHIALDVFVHHYIRLTLKGGYPPFADRDNLIALDQKWSPEQLAWLPAPDGGAR